MTTTTEFILEVQSKGEDKVEDLCENVEDLNKAANASSIASNKMAAGLDKVDKKTRLAERGVNKLKDSYSKLGSVQGLVMAVAGAAIVGYAAKLANAASDLNGLSDDIGINAGKLQVFADVATLAGGSLEGVAASIKTMQLAIGEGVKGNEQIGQIFKDLNIDIREFQKLKPEDQIDKLGQALKGYSITEQDAAIKALKAEGIAKLLKAPDEVAARSSYLEQNGLVISKEELESLNEFTDMWANLTTDVNNFATIILGQVGESLKSIFNMEPDDKNSLLNRETAEQIATFVTRLIGVFKLMYQTLILAGAGMGALVDKGVYVVQVLGVQFDLFKQRLERLGKNLKVVFEDFSMNEVVGKMKANFDIFIAGIQKRIGEIQVKLGSLFRSQTLTSAGMDTIAKAAEKATTAEEALQAIEAKGNDRQEKYNANQNEYLAERNKLHEKLGVINDVNDRKSAENNKTIAEAQKEMGKTLDGIIYKAKEKVKVEKETETSTGKTFTNLNDQKKALDEINKLEQLRIQYLKLQGKDLEANEKARELALKNVNETYANPENRAEATIAVNAIFDEEKAKIQLDKVNKELADLTDESLRTSGFSEKQIGLEDKIAEKTRERIELEKQLRIEQENTATSDFASKAKLIQYNQQLVDGMTDGLVGYINGTKTASEAITSFFQGILDDIMQVIARQLILNAITAAFGGTAASNQSGQTGVFTSLAGAFAGSGSSGGAGWGAALGQFAGSIFHNGGEIQQGDLMQPEGFNFKSDEGFIVAKAQETISTKQQVMDGAGGGQMGDINNNIIIDGDSLTDKLFKTQSMDKNLNNYFKKNGPLIKNYFK